MFPCSHGPITFSGLISLSECQGVSTIIMYEGTDYLRYLQKSYKRYHSKNSRRKLLLIRSYELEGSFEFSDSLLINQTSISFRMALLEFLQ